MNLPISFISDMSNLVFTAFEGKYIQGQVFEGYVDDENVVIYSALKDGSDTENKEEARHLFNFSYCWRGVWEGRIYFKDEEYWGSDIREMADLWDSIELHCQMMIKSKFPGEYFDS